LLAATVRSLALMPLGISNRNTNIKLWGKQLTEKKVQDK